MDLSALHALNPVARVQAVEDWIKQQPGQVAIETRHFFGGGVYEREIFVPAGTLITGKIHLTEHLAKLSVGTMTIYSAEGAATFTGPATFASAPGVKRLGYAHTDCWFSNFHVVGETTDIEAIEKLLVVDAKEQFSALQHTPED